MQAAGADVFGLLVHLIGNLGHAPDAVIGKLDNDPFGLQQGLVLLGQAGIGLGQDALEIGHRQGIQFDTDGEAPLQFGNQVGRLGQVEGAGGDEQDVIGADHAVLGRHGRPFDQRQQVALHALARHIGALCIGAAGHLVDLVEEDDAILLDGLDRLQLHLLVIDQAGSFFIGQQLERFLDLQLARLLLAAAHILEHALDLLGQFFHARRREDLGLHARRGDFDVDFLVVQLALTQLLAEFLAGRIFRSVGLAVLSEKTRAARRR